jgi:hypothetical protein
VAFDAAVIDFPINLLTLGSTTDFPIIFLDIAPHMSGTTNKTTKSRSFLVATKLMLVDSFLYHHKYLFSKMTIDMFPYEA